MMLFSTGVDEEVLIGMPEMFTTVLADVWDGISETVTLISGNPLLLIPVAMTFAGGVIGLSKSLLGFRRRKR